MTELPSGLERMCDAIAQAGRSLATHPGPLGQVGRIAVAAYGFSAALAAEGIDPAPELLKVLRASQILRSLGPIVERRFPQSERSPGAFSAEPSAPDTIPFSAPPPSEDLLPFDDEEDSQP